MKKIIVVALAVFFSGCSVISTMNTALPEHQESTKGVSIAVFALENYTDTPQAGERSANLVEGELLSIEYDVINMIETKETTLEAKLKRAKEAKAEYILLGAVSEWRYKTGIDGEAAVSLQLKLIDTKTSKIVWSATASDSSWGSASIGTTAQSLINAMLSE